MTSTSPIVKNVVEPQSYISYACDPYLTSVQCFNCGHKRPIAIGCGSRICSACMRKEGFKTQKRYREYLHHLWDSAIRHRRRVSFFTLTISNTEKLDFGWIRHQFRKLRQQKKYQNVFKLGLYCLETIHSERGWHTHIHILSDAEYVPQNELSDDWSVLTGSPVVYIQKIYTLKGIKKYVSKYVSKGCGSFDTHTSALEFLENAKNLRMIQKIGNFKDCHVTKRTSYICGECGFVHSRYTRPIINDGLPVVIPSLYFPVEKQKKINYWT